MGNIPAPMRPPPCAGCPREARCRADGFECLAFARYAAGQRWSADQRQQPKHPPTSASASTPTPLPPVPRMKPAAPAPIEAPIAAVPVDRDHEAFAACLRIVEGSSRMRVSRAARELAARSVNAVMQQVGGARPVSTARSVAGTRSAPATHHARR